MSSLPVRSSSPAPAIRKPISAWRIVGGAFLHFAVPAYVVIVATVTLFNAPAGASTTDLARSALSHSGWFLAGYLMLALAATLAAAAIEPMLGFVRGRRDATDTTQAANASRLRVTKAIADARSLPGGDVQRLIDSIAMPRWNHDDSRFQALSQDLVQVVQAMTAANATASDKSRPEIIALATRSLRQIDIGLSSLTEEQARLDHGDAHAVARYVENRYGPSDFAGS